MIFHQPGRSLDLLIVKAVRPFDTGLQSNVPQRNASLTRVDLLLEECALAAGIARVVPFDRRHFKRSWHRALTCNWHSAKQDSGQECYGFPCHPGALRVDTEELKQMFRISSDPRPQFRACLRASMSKSGLGTGMLFPLS